MRAAARWLLTLPVAYAAGGCGTRPTASTQADPRMTEREQSAVTRRGLLKVGALAAAAPLLADEPHAAAQSPARSGTKVHDFQTGADVAKPEQEGELVYYGHDGEQGI